MLISYFGSSSSRKTNGMSFPWLPRLTELLVKEHELVSLNKYSDLLSYQFYPTKMLMKTKAASGSDTSTMK